jgi:hypothetical protein
MRIADHWCRWTAALVVGLLATGGVVAQSPAVKAATALRPNSIRTARR